MSKLFIVISILFILPALVLADINGRVLSRKTENPIPYALIKTAHADYITLSDKNGIFLLRSSEIPCRIIISSQGYETREFIVNDPKGNIIYLSIDPIRIQGLNVITEEGTSLKLSSTDVEILTPDNLVQKGTQELILSHPGLILKESSTGEKQLQLFAYEPRHCVCLIDGIKTDNAAGNTVSSIPINMIDHVEVISHNAGSTSGESAIGGIVNIVLKKSLSQYPTHKLVFHAGSWKNYSINYQNNFALGNSAFLCNLYGHKAKNDFSYYNEQEEKTVRRTNNDIIEGSLAFQSRTNLKENFTSDFSLLYYKANKGIPGQSTDYVWFKDARVRADRIHIKNELHIPFGKNDFTNSLFYQFNKSNYENITDNTSFTYNSTNTTSAFEAQVKLNTKGSILSSISNCGLRYETYKYDDLLHPGNSIGQKNRYLLYISHESAIPMSFFKQEFSLIPSIRADYFVEKDVYLSSHLTLEYPTQSDIIQMSISGGNSFAMPEFSSLFWKGDSRVQGNPDLDPECSYGISSNAKVRVGTFTLNGEAYFNRIENLIYWYRSALGVWKPENLADAELYGFSVSVNWEVFKNFEIECNGSRNYPINKTTSSDHYDKYLTNKPLHKVQGKVSYSFMNIKLFASILDVGKQYDNFSNTVIIDGYTTYDAGLHLTSQIGKKIKASVTFRINNIFNVQYETSRNVPSPGKNFEVSFSTHFL